MKPTSVTAISILSTYLIVIAGYAFYLSSTYQASEYMLDATEGMLFIPDALWPSIIEGGVKGLLTTIALVTAHTLLLTALTLVVGLIGAHYYFPKKEKPKRKEASVDRLRHDDSEYPISVFAPSSIDPLTKETRSGGKIDTLFDDTQYRIRRSNVNPKRAPQNEIEELELVLMQILHAHRNWSSDPAGHHATVGIFEHSIAVRNRMKESSSHPLARVVGLAHDIGKLLAYEPDGDGWKVKTKNHDRLSGEIVRHLPEFWNLRESDQRTLSRVLSYAHSKKLPITLSSEARELIQALKIADGLTTASDRSTSQRALERTDIMDQVKTVLAGLLSELNINNYQGREHTDGWTIEGVEYVAVLESKLRGYIAEHLPHNVATSLQAFVKVESTSYHPMTQAIVQSMTNLDLLITTIGSGETKVVAHEGLFDIKAGRQKFVDVLLLDKEKLSLYEGVNLRRWGSAGYRLRIKESRRVAESNREEE